MPLATSTQPGPAKTPTAHLILLKLSGQACGNREISQTKIQQLAQQLAKINRAGVAIAIVIGGGNFWRFREKKFLPRLESDFLGMLATIFNGVVLAAALKTLKVKVTVFSKIRTPRELALPYNLKQVKQKLSCGEIVLLSGGTGKSGVTTDTAAAEFAKALKCQRFLKATNVRGIFSADPKRNPRAKFLPFLTFAEARQQKIGVCDQSVFRLLAQAKIPITIFNFQPKNNLEKAVQGAKVGSLVNTKPS